jgi:hypothetical protein
VGATMKPFTAVAVVVFTLVALVQLLRLVFGWQVTVNGIAIPMWVSVIALLLAGSLAVMLWRESHQPR